ncbi:nicotinate-nucleotide diphosphorylase (carboxylating) [Hydrogenovibrio sp. SC-1]|uniref:carboxylating nicotinate-nucleotide diphosphorylase n=1 Tax=Hydrogenovibrio sp. SC-1 TaxID=2065820 RepID=UPI000C79B908|nr:carboxylating nicotinate-nucleotide diphosphorylase [Hydrogenovibrio sp. SC-1]PLA74335.1 nicotinate-nucleotide diphosphorylase (carboxylating) [Hydrogenovibrio sp. SC-1]
MTQINYFQDLTVNIQAALQEDIGTGDLTADLIPPTQQSSATVITNEPAIICGRPWFDGVIRAVDANIELDWQVSEGEAVHAGSVICHLKGSAQSILTAERSALNFLQTLSGTATATNRYVKALKNGYTQLLDTRKTLPGLRLAQKYAVHCGGGTNHRIGLYDAILIKENHIMAAGGIEQAVSLAKSHHPNKLIEVETESLAEVEQAVKAKADIIMLDNFSLEMIEQAVEWVNHRCKLEVSGNVELNDLAELTQTGVDYISTGAITKHLHAIDFSMRFHLE